jgi:hypothetical protein
MREPAVVERVSASLEGDGYGADQTTLRSLS